MQIQQAKNHATGKTLLRSNGEAETYPTWYMVSSELYLTPWKNLGSFGHLVPELM
jgi:hypothetical protein